MWVVLLCPLLMLNSFVLKTLFWSGESQGILCLQSWNETCHCLVTLPALHNGWNVQWLTRLPPAALPLRPTGVWAAPKALRCASVTHCRHRKWCVKRYTRWDERWFLERFLVRNARQRILRQPIPLVKKVEESIWLRVKLENLTR